METSFDIPAVLLLRSSCSTPRGTVEASKASTVHGTTSKTTPSDGTKASEHSEYPPDTSNLDRLRDLPLLCDIKILPEIPIEGGTNEFLREHSSAKTAFTTDSVEHYLLSSQQVLNPCGMDNVLLLPQLPPVVANSAFLLSLTSCHVKFSDAEGIITGVDAPLHGNGTQKAKLLPVQAIPSTFSFNLETHSESSGPPTTSDILLSPQGASASLGVTFEYSHAIFLLESIGKEAVDPTATRNSSTGLNVADVSQKPSPPDTCMVHDALIGISKNRDQAMLQLHGMVQKEAHHLDAILTCLGIVWFLLCIACLSTGFRFVRHMKKHREHVVGLDNGVVVPGSFLFSVKEMIRMAMAGVPRIIQNLRKPAASENRHGEKNGMHRPPVNSVTWNADLYTSTPSKRPPPSREFTSSSSHFSEPSSLSEDSLSRSRNNDDPCFAVGNTASHKTRLITPPHQNGTPSLAFESQAKLSPCSQLARSWIMGKSSRRRNRISRKRELAPQRTLITPSPHSTAPRKPSSGVRWFKLSPTAVEGSFNVPSAAEGSTPPLGFTEGCSELSSIFRSSPALREGTVTKSQPAKIQAMTRVEKANSFPRPPFAEVENSFIQDYWST